MNFPSNISALNEDIIVEQLIRSHEPDGRWLDSEMLLQEVETIFSFVLQNDVSMLLLTENCMTNIEVSESNETLPYAISRISVQILCPCTKKNEIQTRTMVLFDLLKEYRWDAKAVIVLGALAATYGGLLLPIHLAISDPVAASIATLNQLPSYQKCTCMPAADPSFQENPAGAFSNLFSIFPVDPFLFLLQQLYDHPSNTTTEQNYEILWIPIPSSQKWTEKEKGNFNIFSNSLPWISVRRPWLMSSTVLKFLRTEWPYRDGETMVVVMDSDGKVVNMDAMDMLLIWGVRAYPFSVSREDELWEEDGWSMQLLLDGIHPEFETWLKEGREICIFGSDSSEWVDEFTSQARKMQNQGFQFELIYLSKRTITSASVKEEGSILFSPAIQQLFWLRLESIKRSKLKRIQSPKSDRVLEEVINLLDFDYSTHKGWAVIGKGSAVAAATEKIVRVDGGKLMKSMSRILRWGEYASGLGFTEAIQIAEEKPCEQSDTVVVPCVEVSTMRVVTCEKCKRPMKRFVAYQ